MGTRNLTSVFSEGECKVAQYGQWDGYPTGVGQDIVKFIIGKLNTKKGIQEFQKKLSKCSFYTKLETGVANDKLSVNDPEELRKFDTYNSRDIGGKILEAIYNSEEKINLMNSFDFAGNSLFCEWAYVVDMDNKTLEVYKGFNKDPISSEERFFNFPREHEEYYPVKLAVKYRFEELTPYTMENLEKKLYEEEE